LLKAAVEALDFAKTDHDNPIYRAAKDVVMQEVVKSETEKYFFEKLDEITISLDRLERTRKWDISSGIGSSRGRTGTLLQIKFLKEISEKVMFDIVQDMAKFGGLLSNGPNRQNMIFSFHPLFPKKDLEQFVEENYYNYPVELIWSVGS
jgi:hypothetical protein